MSSPHDALFKYVFSQPEHAASELRAVLPAELSMRIDWSSLELQPTSFVDERLSGRQADVLFMLRCQGRKTYLYVLLEHQSTPDALMAFRLLRYLVRIWEMGSSAVRLARSSSGWTMVYLRSSSAMTRRTYAELALGADLLLVLHHRPFAAA